MTPLAMEIARDALKKGDEKLLKVLATMHFFEMSGVLENLKSLATDFTRWGVEKTSQAFFESFFLPADNCWFEFESNEGGILVLVAESINIDGKPKAIMCTPFGEGDEFFSTDLSSVIFMENGKIKVARDIDRHDTESVVCATFVLAAMLILNFKGFVEKHPSASHKGMIKKIKQATKIKPQIEWHTVKIKRHAEDESEHHPGEAGGGHKRLHFVRAHLRFITPTHLTRVRAHWRGRKELGTLLSDYEVVA